MNEEGEGRGLLLREMPLDERPRERLLARGSRALGDSELLAILIRSGLPGESALTLARGLLRQFGGLANLAGISTEELVGRGIGPAKAATIAASVELGRRLVRTEVPEREPLANPEVMAQYLLLRYGVLDQEILGVVFLDSRNRLIGEQEVFRGALDRTTVEPRAIFRRALIRGAAGIIVFHTHPSGDPAPSAEDLAFTRNMAAGGDSIGVRLVDHLVLGGFGRFVSLRQRGW